MTNQVKPLSAHIVSTTVDANTIDTLTDKTFYIGFDPTSDSLHIGSLWPLIVTKHLINQGNKAIVLIGTGTAKIGDPSGKTQERTLMSEEQIRANSDRLRAQIESIIGTENVTFVANGDWLDGINLINFLRDVGKHISVNEMLTKTSVRKRLETGLSLTEFMYSAFQGLDFSWLAKAHGCQFQIGGSDQWGNIVSGIDITRRLHGIEVQAFTFDLLIKEDGTKFGKTAEGTSVWLDREKTSPEQMKQFFFNLSDEMAFKLCEKFCLLFNESQLERFKNAEVGSARPFQHLLIEFVLNMVHGTTKTELEEIKVDGGIALRDLLIVAGMSKSKSESDRLIAQSGVKIDGVRAIHTIFIEPTTFELSKGKSQKRKIVIE